MEEVLGGLPSFVSPRPPNHKAIPALAKALSNDIHYSLPDNFLIGAGDTYFSGKMLAKLARIIVIAQELRGLADTEQHDDETQELHEIIRACKSVTLPTEEEVVKAVERLRQGVEVWLNGSAMAPLVYDNSWGGMVSCGCLFNGEDCDNVYPNCPGFSGKMLCINTSTFILEHGLTNNCKSSQTLV
jgi:endoglucanase Acf2